jgi:flagellar protein FlgJ
MRNRDTRLLAGALGLGALYLAFGRDKMDARVDFFTKMNEVAKRVAAEKGWRGWQFISTQSYHEAGNGKTPWALSGLAKAANNFFGVTAELGTFWRTKGYPYIEMPTTEWKKDASGKMVAYPTRRPFRKYDTMEASVRDWARMMATMPVYAKARMGLTSGDFKLFTAGMKEAGYATDPGYEAKLQRVRADVERYLV